MSKHISLCLILFLLISGCSSHKDLKAPCSYNNRSGCGPVIPLQQSA